jgi:NAD(P)-dependent dehydrogenase (short-subunit alcohol dehydrogenase family)
VVGLSRGAALEEAPAIRVNCLAPGPTDTRMMSDIEQTVRDQGGDPSGFVDRIPAGRYGRAEEIAAAAVWLLADAPDFLTGAVVPVDGAMTTP